tara:strand:- start:29995 stop:30480 length:486 start_codon:yes stop_codon:yes gene_type:complete
MNKDKLKEMLKEMSKEELLEVIVEMQSEDNSDTVHSIDKTKPKKRRGKGGRKKKSHSHSKKQFGTDKGDKARSGRIDTSGNRPNKFEDFMDEAVFSSSERAELEEAKASDEANKSVRKSPRSRKSSMVDVRCRLCGKEESVSPALVHDPSRYLCNDCCSRK